MGHSLNFSRPQSIPKWATDLAYAAAGKAWDTLAPRLAPSLGMQNEGFEPGTRPDARTVNWILGQLGDALNYLRNAGITAWTSREVTVAKTPRALAFDDDFGANGENIVILSDSNGTGTSKCTFTVDGATTIVLTSVSPGDLYCGVYVAGTVNKWVFAGANLTTVYTASRDSNVGTAVTVATAGGDGWQGVCYAVGRTHCAVLVGGSGRILTSTNGSTWTARTSIGGADLYAVTHGNSIYIAVGANGWVYRSTDGITWSTISTGLTTTTLRFVCYEYRSGLFVAFGTNGKVTTSPDGTTWSERTSPWATIDAFAYDGNGTILAIGTRSAKRGQRAALSSDGGITWSESYLVDMAWLVTGAIHAGALGWVLCATDAGITKCALLRGISGGA